MTAEPSPGTKMLLDRVDYTDTYATRLVRAKTAFEGTVDAITSTRRLLVAVRVVQRHLLRLDVVRSSPSRPIGWSILGNSAESLVLGTTGPLLTLRVRVAVDRRDVAVSTVVRFEQRIARPIWVCVAPIHRWVTRRLLNAAAQADTNGRGS